MNFNLNFNVDNQAFEDGPATETARILEKVAKKIEEGQLSGKVFDLNGNSIGQYGYIGEE